MEGDELEIKSKAEVVVGKVIKFLKSYGPFLSFIGIIVILFWVKFYDDETEKELSLRGVKTIGTVYDYKYSKNGYWVFCHFKVNGKDYSDGPRASREEVESPNGIKIGAQYEVTYLPESPRRCRIDFSKPISFKSREHYEKVMKLLDSLARVNFNNWKSAD